MEELQKQQEAAEAQADKGAAEPSPDLELAAGGKPAEGEAAPDALQQAMADLENINAHLFSIEALMERIFDVRVPDDVEQTFREVAGELAPDPLNADRLRLNRLLHQTPDLPDRG